MEQYFIDGIELAKDPAFHIAVVWSLWVGNHFKWMEKRIGSLEKVHGVETPPMPFPGIIKAMAYKLFGKG